MKDKIEESIEKGDAGIVSYHNIDAQIGIYNDCIEQLTDAKKEGCNKVLIAAWNNKSRGYTAILIPKKDSAEHFQKLYDKTVSEEPRKIDHYLLMVWGDVEPKLMGPFKDEEARDNAALEHRKEDGEMHDGLFPISVEGSKLDVSCYAGSFFPEGQ